MGALMPETLPMLEKDPRRRFNTSRLLRILVFSFVVATVVVSFLIVAVRFIWENATGNNYDSNPLLILPAIVVITAMMAKLLWDSAEGKVTRRR